MVVTGGLFFRLFQLIVDWHQFNRLFHNILNNQFIIVMCQLLMCKHVAIKSQNTIIRIWKKFAVVPHAMVFTGKEMLEVILF